ncbi:PR domain zinc finger protein 10-like [Macrobrachium nipponense]|uniref:PR domain zinc finger protein 10-like n=1 Tax=Macrobrachium nipponense TaxID=159736 RepID=UPI0030C89437
MPHICSICGKEMPSVDKLKIHMLSHSDRRDFLCPDCGKSFKRKDKMREHSKRMHSAERGDRSPKSVKGPPKFVPKVDPTDYKQFLYKCTICLLGFKRRGMLVNHLAKRHPNVDLKCVPELNQPILKANRCYKCQHCDKRYRSSSKRKLHILKYHPGAELPPRAKPTSDNDTESSSYTSSSPHPCKWCYRQYASRARLLRHQRHHHPSHFNNEGDNETSNINNVAFLDTSAGISGELSLNGQIVADASILRNHRLVNISRETSSSAEAEGTEEDLLTQAMGEITPLAARQVLVSSDGTQQGPTLALVGADVPDTVTLSLPNGQLISLIHGIAVPGAPSTVTSTSRTAGNSDGNVNVAEGVLQREEGSSMRMAYTLGTALNESNNEADAVEQVVLAAQQPSSPSNHVVWQHALAFNSTSS